MISTMRLVFFGSGGSWPSPERNPMSIGLQIDREILLFDVGEGTQRQIMQTSFSFMKISKIFISHFHGDHFLGLAGLIQTMVFNERKEKLEIFGPEDAVEQITNFLRVGYYTLSFPVYIREMKNYETIDFGDYTVTAVKTKHPVTNFAYVFKEKDRKRISQELMEKYSLTSQDVEKIVKNGHIEKNGRKILLDDISDGMRIGRKITYTGDTSPCQDIVKYGRESRILIHDSTVDSSLESKANEFGHSSARQAAEIAREANVDMLILAHISPRYRSGDVDILEKEAKEIFRNTIVAKDFMELQVNIKQ